MLVIQIDRRYLINSKFNVTSSVQAIVCNVTLYIGIYSFTAGQPLPGTVGADLLSAAHVLRVHRRGRARRLPSAPGGEASAQGEVSTRGRVRTSVALRAVQTTETWYAISYLCYKTNMYKIIMTKMSKL